MLRVFGLILCAAALCLLGIAASLSAHKSVEAGKEAIRFLSLLQNEVCDLKKPLSSALSAIEYAGRLPKLLQRELQPWKEDRIKMCLKECGLGREECGIVSKLLLEIPAMQTSGKETFRSAIEELSAVVHMRAEALKATAGLYPKLGVLAGLTLLLLFL